MFCSGQVRFYDTCKFATSRRWAFARYGCATETQEEKSCRLSTDPQTNQIIRERAMKRGEHGETWIVVRKIFVLDSEQPCISLPPRIFYTPSSSSRLASCKRMCGYL
jgi:hypothetical protein